MPRQLKKLLWFVSRLISHVHFSCKKYAQPSACLVSKMKFIFKPTYLANKYMNQTYSISLKTFTIYVNWNKSTTYFCICSFLFNKLKQSWHLSQRILKKCTYMDQALPIHYKFMFYMLILVRIHLNVFKQRENMNI